jgi:hypothetical protein
MVATPPDAYDYRRLSDSINHHAFICQRILFRIIERQCIYLYYTVGLVVEYSPATGETRVQFPDGVSGPSICKFLLHNGAQNFVHLTKHIGCHTGPASTSGLSS